MRKKVLAALLAVCLVIVLCPFSAMAAPAVYPKVFSAAGTPGVSAIIDEQNRLWLWGTNYNDILTNWGCDSEVTWKNNTYSSQTVPLKVMDDAADVSISQTHIGVVKTDGSLWMWGENGSGQLGDGTQTSTSVPTKIMEDVQAVAIGDRISAAIKKDGSLWTWGYSAAGYTGNGGTGNAWRLDNAQLECQTVPEKIMDDVVSVSVGFSHMIALKKDQSLWGWGSNYEGQLGNDGPAEFQLTPVKITDDVISASAGWENTAFVKSDGTLWTCGDNLFCTLGNGTTSNPYDPATTTIFYQTTPIKVLDNMKSVSLGFGVVTALDKDNSLWTWGHNSYQQLGFGEGGNAEDTSGSVFQNTPKKVMENVQAVAPGSCDCLAVDMDGHVWMWGFNAYRQMEEDRGRDDMGRVIIELPELPPFSDVPAGSWFADPVAWAAKENITSGVSDDLFAPDRDCNRGQIVTFLWRAHGSPALQSTENPFVDVSEGDFFYDAVLWAKEQGITSGTDATHFSPNISCNRAQAVTFIWRANGEPEGTGSTFADVDAGAYYEEAVKWAVGREITAGTSDTTFSPTNTCSRGQIVTFLYRDMAK